MVKQSVATKTTHALRSPYPEPEWWQLLLQPCAQMSTNFNRPTISIEVENQIVESLLSILIPIGEHRERSNAQSKGKNRKRSRRNYIENIDRDGIDASPAPIPDIQHHLTIGFNSTIRKLESFIMDSRSIENPDCYHNRSGPALFTIFVYLSSLPPVLTAPLPLLAATASTSASSSTDVRLVPISPTNAPKIAKALKQPHAGFIGISELARGTEELHEVVRTNVEQIKLPWIQSSMCATYEPLKVQIENITVDKPSASGNGKRKAEKIS